MNTKQRAGIDQEKIVVFLEKFVMANGELGHAFDTAKAGDQTFTRHPEESRKDFEERISEAVQREQAGPVITVQMGEAGEY